MFAYGDVSSRGDFADSNDERDEIGDFGDLRAFDE
jgi:hypothetical protein